MHKLGMRIMIFIQKESRNRTDQGRLSHVIYLLSVIAGKTSVYTLTAINLKMLKTKTFVKKTRKGGVMKIVREQYLRDDVWCGVKNCSHCSQAINEAVLEIKPESNSSRFKYPHFVVPDTNIALHQVSWW